MKAKKTPKKSIKLVVIIPAYNEANSLPIVLKNIPKRLLGIKEVQVVVIDDGSDDSTADIARSFNALVLSNGRNMGVGYSFQKGLEKAIELHADILVNMDADGQFSPLDIEKLVYPILEGKADMVTASRFKDKSLTYKMPFIKKYGNKAFIYLINTLTHKKFTDVTCGFRSYSKEAMLNLTVFGQFTYTQEVFLDLASKNMKIIEVPIKVFPRTSGKSKVTKSLIKYIFNSNLIVMKAFRDYQPLTFFGLIGLFFFSFGFFVDFILFIRWLSIHRTSPYETLVNIGIFSMIFGFLLIVLALLADMLDRQRRLNERILYYQRRNMNGFK